MSQCHDLNEAETLEALIRQDLYAFTWRAFNALHPGPEQKFIPAWHVQAVCHALQEVAQGSLLRLLITVPPRHLKSICTSVAFPAWMLGRDPSCKIMVASYGTDLARQHSEQFRTVIAGSWYQRAFANTRINARVNRFNEIYMTMGGGRKAVSVGGPATGFGANILIVDDLLKAEEARSETERMRALEYYHGTLLSRLENRAKAAIIVIQQRLHEDDLAGRLIEEGVFHHLNLPAIAVMDEEIPIGPGLVHRRRVGEALFPEMQDLSVLERSRREMGNAYFNAQYQQDPVAPDGARVRPEWFGMYDEEPRREAFQYVVQSWDTGMTALPTSDYSVCTTWGHRAGKWHLLDLFRRRLDYGDLKRAVIRLRDHWRADRVIVEYAGAGISLFSDFRNEGLGHLVSYKPSVDKEARLEAQTAKLETGNYLLPRQAPWLEAFLRELTAFPNGRYDDQVDSMSQFLDWIGWRGRALLDTDPVTGRRLGNLRREGRPFG